MMNEYSLAKLQLSNRLIKDKLCDAVRQYNIDLCALWHITESYTFNKSELSKLLYIEFE